MPALIPTGDGQCPGVARLIRECGLPRSQQRNKPFLRMKASEIKQYLFAAGERFECGALDRRLPIFSRSRQINSVGEDANRILQSVAPEVFRLGRAEGVETAGRAQVFIFECPGGETLFPARVPQCPRFKHSVWRNHPNRAARIRQFSCQQTRIHPQTMHMNQGIFLHARAQLAGKFRRKAKGGRAGNATRKKRPIPRKSRRLPAWAGKPGDNTIGSIAPKLRRQRTNNGWNAAAGG